MPDSTRSTAGERQASLYQNVPLGFVSLTENLVMIAIGFWMLVK